MVAESRGGLAVALALVALAADPVLAQTAPNTSQPKKKDRRGLIWDDTRPSIVFGKDINIDFRFKIQMDWRQFDPEIGAGDEDFSGTFDIETKRFGIKGELTKHFEYEVEHEIAKSEPVTGGAAASTKVLWKDVFIKWRTLDTLQIAVGRFKVPFGLEQNTGKSSTDFAYRTLASSTITPARDTGVLANGRFFGRGLTYELGVFQHDGDNGRLREPQFVESGDEIPEPGPSLAGRVTAAVLRPLGVPEVRGVFAWALPTPRQSCPKASTACAVSRSSVPRTSSIGSMSKGGVSALAASCRGRQARLASRASGCRRVRTATTRGIAIRTSAPFSAPAGTRALPGFSPARTKPTTSFPTSRCSKEASEPSKLARAMTSWDSPAPSTKGPRFRIRVPTT